MLSSPPPFWEVMTTPAPARLRGALALIAGLLGLACVDRASPPSASPVTNETAVDKGALVIIGGRLEPDNQALYERMLELRPEPGPVCVLPTASAEPERSMQAYVEDFLRHGGPDAGVGVALFAAQPEGAEDPQIVASLDSCAGFFFTGGDQSRILDTLRPGGRETPADRAIRARHEAGAFIAGTSAGAAMMSDPMIAGGDPSTALVEGGCSTPECPGVWLRPGMGYWSGGLSDQHFLARDRVWRLLAALLDQPGELHVGLGVDEDTGVIVRGDEAEVVGRSGAMRVDVSALEPLGSPDAPRWRGATLAVFGPGDRFRLSDGALLQAGTSPSKSATTPPPFIAQLMDMRSDSEALPAEGPGWSVLVRPGPGFVAHEGPAPLGHAGPFVLERL